MAITSFAGAACLSEPRFDSAVSDAEVDDAMVLISSASAPDRLREDDEEEGEEREQKRRGKERSEEPDRRAPDAGVPTFDAGPAAPPSTPPPARRPTPFWIDVREVAHRDYAVCARSGPCHAAACTAPSPAHPVACVTRDQAIAYCAWRKKRLVRDEEWSRAAGDGTYPWGNAGPSAERVRACSDRDACTSAPRGSSPKGATREGVLDLAGNVAEWVDAEVPIVRGGSFTDVDEAAFVSSARRSVEATRSAPTIGFRCARDP